jgi:hypothetical protein
MAIATDPAVTTETVETETSSPSETSNFALPASSNGHNKQPSPAKEEPQEPPKGQPAGQPAAQKLTENHVARRIAKHCLLAAILIGLTIGCSELFSSIAQRHATGWKANLKPDEQLALKFGPDSPANQAEQARLQEQVERIRKRIKLHLDVMEFFYIRYYMVILTFAIAGALAAITLVLVSKRGWEQTNEYILTAFFVMTACAVFFGAFPGMFQQEQNIKENKALYLKYEALENEVLSFAATYEPLLRETKADALANKLPQQAKTAIPERVRKFIHYIDEQLAQGNIAIGFDYSQIPTYKNAFEVQ